VLFRFSIFNAEYSLLVRSRLQLVQPALETNRKSQWLANVSRFEPTLSCPCLSRRAALTLIKPFEVETISHRTAQYFRNLASLHKHDGRARETLARCVIASRCARIVTKKDADGPLQAFTRQEVLISPSSLRCGQSQVNFEAGISARRVLSRNRVCGFASTYRRWISFILNPKCPWSSS